MAGINRMTYYLCLAGICLGIILGLGLGIAMGSLLVITLVVIIAMIGAYVFHRRINEVMTDDLSEAISGKAAIRTLEILTVLGAILFASTMMLYWGTGGGLGSGIHTFDNGSATIHFSVWYPDFHPVYDERVFIQEMNNISGDELFSLERLFGLGYRVRDGPMFMGLAFGIMTILTAGLFAAFSYYYNKKMDPET
ncbi:MAG: DUF2178 domain-containing protein [Methanomicrobiales archaeon]|nr:DUF2178 domain-containing protein [Methanomicrobiales archaeon]